MVPFHYLPLVNTYCTDLEAIVERMSSKFSKSEKEVCGHVQNSMVHKNSLRKLRVERSSLEIT